MSVYYESAEVETCAAVKANVYANCYVYSVISDAQTLENSSNQCNAMFSQIFGSFKSVWSGITGRNSLCAENGDRLLSQTRSLTTATVQ